MKFKACETSPTRIAKRIAAALSEQPADMVVQNGKILDVFGAEFFEGDLAIFDGIIVGTHDAYSSSTIIDATGCYIVPGFIDSHVHIESSLTTPCRFQEAVLPHGTTTVLWDPHEIANVKGIAGIEWALAATENLLLDVFLLLPSCVPATDLETSAAKLSSADLSPFRQHKRVLGLAEFMNVPGILTGNSDALQKLADFSGFIRDGHAPVLSGKALNAYLCSGIHGCHESTSDAEAREKLKKGMHILIREGSCAKDADALLGLLNACTSTVLGFCSDDRNPLDIEESGHIDCIINKALARGIAPEIVFRAASFGAAFSYGLHDRGVAAPGYIADLCLVRQKKHGDWSAGIEIVQVIKSGQQVHKTHLQEFADRDQQIHPYEFSTAQNVSLGKNLCVSSFLALAPPPSVEKFMSNETVTCRVIGVIPGQIITQSLTADFFANSEGHLEADASRDLLKIAVCERHGGTGQMCVGFVQGFGIKKGAIASTIGHDSHNITAVGSSDVSIYSAVKKLEEINGGIVVVDEKGTLMASLTLEIGGLMTSKPLTVVTSALQRLKESAREIGCSLEEPFLQLSFLALPVIPKLKITDLGLVDVEQFCHVPLVCK